MTSHAAVVALGMGTPVVSGCGTIRVDYSRGTMSIGSRPSDRRRHPIDASLGPQVAAGGSDERRNCRANSDAVGGQISVRKT